MLTRLHANATTTPKVRPARRPDAPAGGPRPCLRTAGDERGGALRSEAT